MVALGLSTKPRTQGGDNECFNIQHFEEGGLDEDGDEIAMVPIEDQIYRVDGQSYKSTGGFVRFGVNQRGGSKYLRSSAAIQALSTSNEARS
jgi:hypothetical protein